MPEFSAMSSFSTRLISSGSCSKPMGGEWATISSPGATWCNRAAASCTDSSVPPIKTSGTPSSRARSARFHTKSEPAMRSWSGVPCRRLAHTRGMPSATRQVGLAQQLSTFGVT